MSLTTKPLTIGDFEGMTTDEIRKELNRLSPRILSMSDVYKKASQIAETFHEEIYRSDS